MSEQLGTVTVAPDVIREIVRQTARAIPGVARMDTFQSPRVNRLLTARAATGIALDLDADLATIDLYIIAEPDAPMLSLGQTLQREIQRAVEDGLGMSVKQINVHIEDVADRFATTPE
ncbi:MAG: Asp23/Gls24 family envelope stress response protein [Chloroflexi bacterium]|nr:Asp23/Gls24 family envelope stress response protein [Chloroflexota bacterium]